MEKHDRRLAPRFATTDTEALLVSQCLIVSLSLLDISETGLAFSYINGSGHENWIGEEREIDLFGEEFWILGISVKIISDRAFSHFEMGESLNAEQLYLRRCGVQFSLLNSKQKNQVDSYVESLGSLRIKEN